MLNAIDDTLDKGKPRARPTGPSRRSRTCARSSTRPAARGRPVILTADHGHVLERGTADGRPASASAAQSDSARYRIGTAGAGEIVDPRPACPRRTAAGRSVVAAVDETIHYTPRKAGYHGGASLAEVVIPVITLLPSESLLPPGWYAYDAARARPCLVGRAGVARHAPQPAIRRDSGPAQAAAARRRPAPSAPVGAPPDDAGALFARQPKRRHARRSRPAPRPSAPRSSRRPGWRASASRSAAPPTMPASPR